MQRVTVARLLSALAICAVANLALAQNADKNSAAPTKNDLKLRIVEPAEGAVITGGTVRITIDYDRTHYRTAEGTKRTENFPEPTFDVFVDNTRMQTVKGGESNVATLENIPPGSHKIVVMAKNISGEVVDRKEINIQTVPESAAATSSQSNPPVSTEPSTSRYPSASSGTSSSMPQTAGDTSISASKTARSTTLPKTASDAPRAGAIGVALVAAGLLLARRSR